MHRVLIVDDEPALVSGLKKALRPWREEFEIETVVSGRAAIALLSAQRYDVVISDARMPEVDGEEVLACAHATQPGAVRLLLSGQVDARAAHRLGRHAHQLLLKPTSGPALRAAISECQRVIALLENKSLRETVASVKGLPVGPRNYQRITRLIDSPDGKINDIAGLITEDPSLSASVLRFVNSAFFGLGRTVDTVRGAVVLLGLERIRELVLVSELLCGPEPLGIFDEVRKRSLLRARLARMLTAGSPVVDLASEGALLSEVGLYVLASWSLERFRHTQNEYLSGNEKLDVLERAAFGATHGEVGAVLLGLWGLPPAVVNVVRWSDAPIPEDARLDARTATALTTMLELEHRGLTDEGELERVAGQLGVGDRLPAVREVVETFFSHSLTGVAA